MLTSAFFPFFAPDWALLALEFLVVQSLTTSLAFFREWINSFHVCLQKVVLVLNPVFNQVLKLFHFDFDNYLVDVWIAAAMTVKIICIILFLSIRRARSIVVPLLVGRVSECILLKESQIGIALQVEHGN